MRRAADQCKSKQSRLDVASLSGCKRLTEARSHCGALMDAPGFTSNTPVQHMQIWPRISHWWVAKRPLTRSWPRWLLSNRAASLLIWGRLATALSCSCEQLPPPFNPLPLLPAANCPPATYPPLGNGDGCF